MWCCHVKFWTCALPSAASSPNLFLLRRHRMQWFIRADLFQSPQSPSAKNKIKYGPLKCKFKKTSAYFLSFSRTNTLIFTVTQSLMFFSWKLNVSQTQEDVPDTWLSSHSLCSFSSNFLADTLFLKKQFIEQDQEVTTKCFKVSSKNLARYSLL